MDVMRSEAHKEAGRYKKQQLDEQLGKVKLDTFSCKIGYNSLSTNVYFYLYPTQQGK
jgi:hypothetical protein